MKRQGYTNTGFSKSGFSACGHWEYCQLGKGECFYQEKDPEVKEYCDCYKRNHVATGLVETKESTIGVGSNKKEKEINESKEQLSLF